jgi:hypothetical protein
MEVISDCDSIASADTVDMGFALVEEGRIKIETPSAIYTHKCANCYRTFEVDEKFKNFKYNYKRSDFGIYKLFFCCKGCRLWGLYKLGRNKYRPRLSCTCKISNVEGRKYVPPTLSTPGRKYRIVVYQGFYFIEELPVTLAEMFAPLRIDNEVYRSRQRSRSR